MPAKKQITRENILDCAFSIVRDGGMEKLNMRTLANRCGCSTQPIYLSFSGSDELKSEVIKRILAFYEDFMRREMSSGKYNEYKSMGMGYINFARQEPELFKFLFMRRREDGVGLGEDSFDAVAMSIMNGNGLERDKARMLHAEMWVFVHGIATMCVTGYLDWDMDTVSIMLTDAFQGLTGRLKGGNK